MKREISDSFLWICKQNYFDKITPANELSRSTEGYKKLVAISKSFFENNEYHVFCGYFMESQYFIQLWTAHLLLEYGNASDEIIRMCIKEIKKYCETLLAPNVAREEKLWLLDNADKYERFL